MPAPKNLNELETDLARDLALLNFPPAAWVPEAKTDDGRPVQDVVIAGAGMLGLTASFALRRQGIVRQRILDRAQPGREGPWVTYARMTTLRSPKHLSGPCMGIPSLTFRAWYEAQFGPAAWESLGKIPRAMWMDYLNWYRRVLAVPVESSTQVIAVEPATHGLDVHLLHADGSEEVAAARKLVLATGREGQARRRIPAPFLPFYGAEVSHTADEIDFTLLAGKDVAVIGLGASAIDNAACALEAGAASVTIMARAPEVPRINKAKGIVYGGFVEGLPALPPEWRLKLLDYIASFRVAPPRDSVLRVFQHPNARLVLDAPVLSAGKKGGRLCLETSLGQIVADHVILGTGFAIDLSAAPEIAGFAGNILTHADSLAQIATPGQAEWLAFPDLSPSFHFQERQQDKTPFIKNIYCFTYSAALSHGNVSGDIPSVSEGAERLARGMAADFFSDNLQEHWQALERFDDPELFGDEIEGPVAWHPPL